MIVLPYLLVKAKIKHLLAHSNFIEAFHFSMSDGDQIEVYKTNLKIAMQRIKHFKVPGSPEFEESKLESMGEEFEMVLTVEDQVKQSQ